VVDLEAQIPALAISVVQVLPFFLFGMAICKYGEHVNNIFLLMQAMMMANYFMWIPFVAAIDTKFHDNGTSMWVAIDQGVILVFITVQLYMASKDNPRSKHIQSVFVLCTLLVTLLLDMIQTLALTEHLDCKMTGPKSVYFPSGGPVGCDTKGRDFKLIFNSMRVAFWLSLPAVKMVAGTPENPKKCFTYLVYGMVGASLMIDTLMDMLNIIIPMADPKSLERLNFYFPTIKPWIMYGVAGLGIIHQKTTKGGCLMNKFKKLDNCIKRLYKLMGGKADDGGDDGGCFGKKVAPK